MAKAYASAVINAPVDKVWNYVKNFNNLPDWFPNVTTSEIEGSKIIEIGCIRKLAYPDGSTVRERLEAISEIDKSFSYSVIQHPLPVQNCVAHVKLSSVSTTDKTFFEYTVIFDLPPDMIDGVKGFIKEVWTAAYDVLNEKLK